MANSTILLLSSFWKTIEYYDQTVLFYINQRGSNVLFDALLPWCRAAIIWAPLYLFLAAFSVVNFGKKGWWWIIFLIITIALTDQISSGFFKPFFARLRPCADPMMIPYIKLRIAQCSGAFSFTSSHAANHFGIAMFAVSTLQTTTGRIIKYLFIWAAIICYAQMYVGVHYPLDIMGGTAIGLIVGAITAKFFNRNITLQ